MYCLFTDMFRQLFSAAGGKLTLTRFAFSQIKPSIFVPRITCISARPLTSELCVCRQFYSVPPINSQLHYLPHQAVGQSVFYRGYANDARRQQSSSATASYIIAVFIFMIGAAYAGVPMYRMICQVNSDAQLFLFYEFCILHNVYSLIQ